MTSSLLGAELGIDLRDSSGRARHRRVQVLYDPSYGPATLSIQLDAGPESVHELGGSAAHGELSLSSARGIGTIRLVLLSGRLRFHGLSLDPPGDGPAKLVDVFGTPGSTVVPWSRTDPLAVRKWFEGREPALVMLVYGSNEATRRNFTEDAYRAVLVRAVANLRRAFPHAACVLVGPADHGTLRARHRRADTLPTPDPTASWAPGQVLPLDRALRHAVIGAIQREVAAKSGCLAWSMMDAMGGPGSADSWKRLSPRLMSSDSVHLTESGYRKLGWLLAKELGFEPRAAP